MRKWIITLGGAGLMPFAPGTWGSLVAAIWLYLLLWAVGPAAWALVSILGILFFSVLAVALGRWGVEHFGRKDPGPFVLDEAAGIFLTALLLPPSTGRKLALSVLLVFATFRVFDIVKLAPARQLEKLPEGWGILFDDLAAAVYANLVCQLVVRLWLR